MGGIRPLFWRTIRPDKKHPCRREFVHLEFGSVFGSLRHQTAARCSAARIEFPLVNRSSLRGRSLTASLIEKPDLAPVFNTRVISECRIGSGTRDEDFQHAIKAGMINAHVDTELRLAWRRCFENALQTHPSEIAPYKILPAVVQP